MPTYEYACKSCGEHLEVVQSFRDDPLTECPACHGELRKVFSAAGLIFKGSGWHIKDYSSSGKPSGASASGDKDGASSESSSAPGSGTGSGSGSAEGPSGAGTGSSGKGDKASTSGVAESA